LWTVSYSCAASVFIPSGLFQYRISEVMNLHKHFIGSLVGGCVDYKATLIDSATILRTLSKTRTHDPSVQVAPRHNEF
jgi:hypothetical protein